MLTVSEVIEEKKEEVMVWVATVEEVQETGVLVGEFAASTCHVAGLSEFGGGTREPRPLLLPLLLLLLLRGQEMERTDVRSVREIFDEGMRHRLGTAVREIMRSLVSQ